MNRYDDMPDQTPQERDARHHRVLHRLADIVMAEAEALAVDTESPRLDKSRTLARVARAVRTTVALDARLADWAIERERKRRALDAETAAGVRREHIRKTKRKVVLAFRDIVERGADREYLDLAENLMDSERYDEELYELPFTEALAIVANDLGGNCDRKTFGTGSRPAGTEPPAPCADLRPADLTPETDLSAEALAKADPMRGANALDDPAPAPYRPTGNGYDPP